MSLPHRPVFVRGAAGGTTHHSIQGMADMTVTAAAVSGPKAFAEAGITPADVDVFEMYDSFTYTVLVVLEDLGFAPKGEGGPFVADGNLRLGGALPTNTDGGGLSATHPGMRGPVPAVRSDPSAARRSRRRAGAGRRDRGRARQRRLAVDAGHCRARNGAGMSTSGNGRGSRRRTICGRRRRPTTASSGQVRTAASCASSAARRAGATSTTRACCARTAVRDTLDVRDGERARHGVLVHGHPPERCAAVQRTRAVRGRDGRPRRGRARASSRRCRARARATRRSACGCAPRSVLPATSSASSTSNPREHARASGVPDDSSVPCVP